MCQTFLIMADIDTNLPTRQARASWEKTFDETFLRSFVKVCTHYPF